MKNTPHFNAEKGENLPGSVIHTVSDETLIRISISKEGGNGYSITLKKNDRIRVRFLGEDSFRKKIFRVEGWTSWKETSDGARLILVDEQSTFKRKKSYHIAGNFSDIEVVPENEG